MNNNFEEVYEELEALRDKYDDTENEYDKEEYRKEYQKKFYGMPKVFRIWKESKDHGNDDIDIDYPITNIDEIVKEMKEYGISKFTFSSGWSETIETSFAFVKAGCKLVGMTEINGRYNELEKRYDRKPAYVFEIA